MTNKEYEVEFSQVGLQDKKQYIEDTLEGLLYDLETITEIDMDIVRDKLQKAVDVSTGSRGEYFYWDRKFRSKPNWCWCSSEQKERHYTTTN